MHDTQPMRGLDYRRETEKVSLAQDNELVRRSKVTASLATDEEKQKISDFLRSGFGRFPERLNEPNPYVPTVIAPAEMEVPW